jgi:hypothetical protein
MKHLEIQKEMKMSPEDQHLFFGISQSVSTTWKPYQEGAQYSFDISQRASKNSLGSATADAR